MKARYISFLLAVTLLTSVLAGCTSSNQGTPVESAPNETVSVPESEETAAQPSASPAASEETPGEVAPESELEAETVADESFVYDLPLTDQDVTFSIWCEAAPGFMAPYLGSEGNFNTAEATLYTEEITGIDLDYRCIDASAATEQFNLMIASGEYPDMVQSLPSRYSGGAEQAYADEVILDMTDYINNQMPVYKKLITDLSIEADLTNDDGRQLGIASVTTGSLQTRGPTVRTDWLTALGMDKPGTYDELHDMALAMKSAYDLDGVFYFFKTICPDVTFTAGYDLPCVDINTSGSHLYQMDGNVVSAFTQDNFRELLALIRDWYSEGLLYTDFYNMNGMEGNNLFLGGKYAMVWDNANYITQNMKKSEDFESGGLPLTRKEAGQTLHFFGSSSSAAINFCVTTACENVDILVKFLDFMFTEQGQLLANYGMEGKTYYLDESGLPQWMEETYTNENTPFQMMIVSYILADLPSVYDDGRQLSVTLDELGMEAMDIWNEDPNTDGEYLMDAQVTYNEEETAVYSAHISDVETYAASFILKAITGETELEAGWDAYVDQLYELGLQDCLDVVQTAYDRALAKKYGA